MFSYFSLESPSERELRDLCSEINIMSKIGDHPNVVSLIGACTINGESTYHAVIYGKEGVNFSELLNLKDFTTTRKLSASKTFFKLLSPCWIVLKDCNL